MKILHIGVPSTKEMPGEVYYEDFKEYCTNPDDHPYKLEFFRFPDGCDKLPQEIVNTWHVCIEVDNIDEAMEDMDEIILPVLRDATPVFAFAKKDDVLLEIREKC